jgi:predicted RNA-binding Zn-ribbon protein involved in translation (DUF1610 family)
MVEAFFFQFDPSDRFVASDEDRKKAEGIAAHQFPPEMGQGPSIGQQIIGLLGDYMKRAEEADAAAIADSKSIVAASGGAKMLCPRCGGSKLILRKTYDSSSNPYDTETQFWDHLHFEQNRDQVDVVKCPECGGTGVVNAR